MPDAVICRKKCSFLILLFVFPEVLFFSWHPSVFLCKASRTPRGYFCLLSFPCLSMLSRGDEGSIVINGEQKYLRGPEKKDDEC